MTMESSLDIILGSIAGVNFLFFVAYSCFLIRKTSEQPSWLSKVPKFVSFLLQTLLAGLIFSSDYTSEISDTIFTISVAQWLFMAIFFLWEAFASSFPNFNLRSVRRGKEGEASEPLLGSQEQSDRLPGVTLNLESVSLWSLLTFQWMNHLLSRGFKKTLTMDDCPELGHQDKATLQHDKFRRQWERRQAAVVEEGKVSGGYFLLMWALWDTFWPQMIFNGSMAAVYLGCVYTGPVMLGILVDFVGREDRTLREGLLLVGILLVSKVVQSLAERRWQFGVERLGVWISSALTGSVYQKIMKLSSVARAEHGAGEAINYLSVDVQRIADFMDWMHDTWLLPVQTVIALAILFRTMGWASLAGMAVIFTCLSLQIPLGRQSEKVQAKLMAAKDARMKATSECLNGMRVIKLWAWEDHFRTKLQKLRSKEYKWLNVSAALKMTNVFVMYLCQLAVAFATLGTAVLIGRPALTSARIFTAIATFRIIQGPLFLLPVLVIQLVEATVSLERLQKLLCSEELRSDVVTRAQGNDEAGSQSEKNVVSIKDGTFAWGKDADTLGLVPILQNISINVPKGATVAICGTVGSGKSSLLAAIMGEMEKVKGQVFVEGSVAYVSQSPWIQTGSLRDNILFGQSEVSDLYRNAIRVSALEPDLAALPGGDLTLIGERGVNVSGGQKQRVQLARAVYLDADVYLLDDPFSAVDAHTGSEIFRECVMGALASKTVILVTHQVEFLPAVDMILVMRNGEIVQSGRYDELLSSGTDFLELVAAHNKAMDSVDQVVHPSKSVSQNGRDSLDRPPSMPREKSDAEVPMPEETNSAPIREEAELTEQGSVAFGVYASYLTRVWRGALVPLILLAVVTYQFFQVAGNYWLSYAATPEHGVSPMRMVKVYGWLTAGGLLFVLVRTASMIFGGVATAESFFRGMLGSLFETSMAFFDSTPTGRILSRVSYDQSTLDLMIPQSFSSTVRNFSELSAIIFVMASITPQMLFASLPCALIVVLLQRYYLKSSREFTRIQGTSKAPIINHFSESVAGAFTIRAFGRSEQFFHHSLQLVDLNNRPVLLNSGASHWFMLRLETVSVVVFSCTALLLVMLPKEIISPALAGLSLAYGLTLNGALCQWAWWSSQLENKIISVERIKQYTSLPPQAPAVIEDCRPPCDWPSEGAVTVRDLQVRYQDNAPLVLKGLTFSVASGEKVGVVGRTGSGKSTLIQAMFRVVEPVCGSIIIDGLDVSTIGLKDLRRHLSIIPQEPTLFQGNVRSNLDPLEEFSDVDIWEALDKCQLGEIMRGKDEKLDTLVSEGGENWSVGQRQLFCLGRALLKRSKILVLDEATASVDSATDGLIQATIAKNFSDCTVITVAHRIPTVIDSDKVLVLEQGKLAEYDSPTHLLENKRSMFAKLVSEYSKRSGSMADLGSQPHI